MLNINYPRNIICLTEESVETLYAIGLQDIVSGVSIFVKRSKEAQNKPKT
jgi:iron complex transport system substrate-binding protein